MGAYSASRVPAADPASGEQAATPPQEPVITASAPAEPHRPMRFAVPAKWAAWLFFAGGLVGAVLGIAGLHVEVTVAGLILACTAGLVLLKIRADASPAEETA